MPQRLDPLDRSSQLRRMRDRARDGQLAHSFLLIGPEGSAKEFTAMELARAVLCEADSLCPVDAPACAACRKTKALHHPDVLYAFPAESSLTLDAYRELVDLRAADPLRRLPQPSSAILAIGDPQDPAPASVRSIRRFVGGKPFEGRRRVAIVGDAHRMNRAAANALLKTLEEPPATALLLLCSHQPHLLPSTVRSRCARVQVPPLSPTELADHLQAAHGIAQADASRVAAVSGGNARRALDLLDPVAQRVADWASRVLGWMLDGDLPALLKAAERIPKGQDPAGGKGSKLTDGSLTASRDIASRVLDFLVSDFLTLERLADGAGVDPLQRERLGQVANRLAPGEAARRVELLLAAREDLHRNVNVALVLTHLMMRSVGSAQEA